MTHTRSVATKLAFIFLFCALFARDAHAYLDPGTGSYIYQVIIAAILGGTFVVKMGWSRIVAFLRRAFSRKGKE